MSNLTDREFLEAIVSDLDEGWVTGTMCNSIGKCLVGAGAAAMGLNYAEQLKKERELRDLHLNGEIDYETYATGRDTLWHENYAVESAAAERLFDLLSDEMQDYLECVIEDAGSGSEDIALEDLDPIDAVTGYNDTREDYVQIREKLEKKIKELADD